MATKTQKVKVKRQPRQPIIIDPNGEKRFQENKIVQFLLDNSKAKSPLDTIAAMGFPVEDRRQFAQLIGYSVRGYGEFYFAENKLGCKCAIHREERAEFRAATKARAESAKAGAVSS